MFTAVFVVLPPYGIEPSMQIVIWLFGSTFGFHVITLIHNQMCPVVNHIIYSMNQSWTCREWCCPGVSSMVCAMKWHCNWPKWHFIVCVAHGNPQGLLVIGIGHCFSVWILAKVSGVHWTYETFQKWYALWFQEFSCHLLGLAILFSCIIYSMGLLYCSCSWFHVGFQYLVMVQ